MIYKLFFLIYKNYLCKIAKQILFTWKIYFWYDHLHEYIIPDATQQEYKKNTSLFAANWFGRRKMFHVPDVLFWEIVFTTNY